jgi:signal transduction histidine kinase/CheY-like chemotaxis protein
VSWGRLTEQLEWLEAYFLPERLRNDPVAVRQAGVVIGFALVPVPFIPILALLQWWSFPPSVAACVVPLVFGVAPLCVAVPFVLRASGSTQIAGNLLLAYAFVLFGTVMYFCGGPVSPPSFWNVLLPMSSVALAGRRWAAFWTVAVIGEAAAVVWLDRHGFGFVDQMLPERRPFYWLASISTLTSFVLLAGLVYERSKDTSLHTLESANRALAAARDAEERASQTKSEFLRNLSHEVRTPMTAILGFTDVLYDEWSERRVPAHSLAGLAVIQRNGRQLLELINDLLDMSKIEAGKLELERLPFSPEELLADVIEHRRPRAAAKQLGLALEPIAPLPRGVLGDPGRLRQVAENLLDNALAFTERGQVRVRLALHGDERGTRLELSVIDTGAGIAPERLASVFQPFVQAGTPGAAGGERIGLGLAMCERLTDLMGGEISVASALGCGSEFRVRVPVEPLAELPSVAEPASPESAEAARAPVAPLELSLLLVDDGVDNLRLISHVLRRVGAQVDTADNGRLALEKVAEAERAGAPYDAVLMDMQMPEMDGLTATRLLRERGFARPIMALTAHAVPGTRERCLEAGCDDYATKPVDRRELIERIRRLCSKPA